MLLSERSSKCTSQAGYWVGMVIVLCLFAGTIWGQTLTASMSGTVKDTSGAIVAGATVTITSLETGATRTVESDTTGDYKATALPVGRYQVSAEKMGFRMEIRQGIHACRGTARL